MAEFFIDIVDSIEAHPASSSLLGVIIASIIGGVFLLLKNVLLLLNNVFLLLKNVFLLLKNVSLLLKNVFLLLKNVFLLWAKRKKSLPAQQAAPIPPPPHIPLEKYRELAEQHGVAIAAIKGFFQRLKDQDIPQAGWASRLPEFAERYNDLMAQLATADNRDEAVIDLRRRAEKALQDGDFAVAEESLAEAEEAATTSAARLAYERGELAETLIAYGAAAQHFARAATLAGDDDPLFTADALNNAGLNAHHSAQWAEAESLHKRALEISKKSLGPDHPHVAASLNNLALLYRATNRLTEAESLYQRALEISKKSLGPDHPDVANSLNNLAALYHDTNRLTEAESLYQRALEIREKSLGPDHPNIAASLNNLAYLYQATNRLTEAESLYQRALKISEKSRGPDHPHVAASLNNLAQLYRATNRLTEAEPRLQRAVKIFEKSLGPDHPRTQQAAGNLAGVRQEMGK